MTNQEIANRVDSADKHLRAWISAYQRTHPGDFELCIPMAVQEMLHRLHIDLLKDMACTTTK